MERDQPACLTNTPYHHLPTTTTRPASASHQLHHISPSPLYQFIVVLYSTVPHILHPISVANLSDNITYPSMISSPQSSTLLFSHFLTAIAVSPLELFYLTRMPDDMAYHSEHSLSKQIRFPSLQGYQGVGSTTVRPPIFSPFTPLLKSLF